MATESSVETKAKEVVRRAIAALQARGFDVNAYSVALEARLPRWFIANNRILMQLVAEARGAQNGHDGTEDLSSKVQKLSRDLEESTWENTVLRRYFQESKAENQTLRDELTRTQQELARLKEDSGANSVQMQLAFQQGFNAGQKSVAGDQLQTNSDLATAAAKATTAGAHTAASIAEYMKRTAEPESGPVPAPGEDEPAAYVSDVPLHIEDPEVLSDPFTARLLNALHAEEQEPEAEAVMPGESHAFTFSGQPDPMAEALEQDNQAQEEHAQPGNGSADAGMYEQKDLLDPSMLVENHEDITDRFTAEELHSLFRNHYVRHDDPPEAPKAATAEPAAATAPQPAKKFVGGKHASANDPLPTTPRAVPPDIRKACKLLGVLPEEVATRAHVIEAWKREMSKPGVHPDQGGDTEMAIYLNTAKDTLLRWIENQTPKLGKKFGQQGKTQEATKPRKQE
jgi:hypothetical protein